MQWCLYTEQGFSHHTSFLIEFEYMYFLVVIDLKLNLKSKSEREGALELHV